MRQVITRPCIEWEGSVLNQTVLGDTIWKDYSIKKEKITVSIDGNTVCEMDDDSFSHGLAGMGTSFHKVDFDNFMVW
ncbi:MAG: hypothetical protein LBT25_08660 [Candidatus Symbiothrix sp.]|nr:hypothetical protein [Candidatus Symbiothrix sp.]